MSDFKTTPEQDLTTNQLLDRYQIQDEYILQNWASLHGINGDRSTFSPREVDLIDHAHHHLHNLSMSVTEYQDLVDRRPHHHAVPAPSQPSNSVYLNPGKTHNKSDSNQPLKQSSATQNQEELEAQATDAIEMLMAQYSEAIDYMGEQIADNFIDELDTSVMRHLVRKVKERQQTQSPTAPPNRLMKAIQIVFQSKNNSLLAPSSSEDSGLQMENTHRLG